MGLAEIVPLLAIERAGDAGIPVLRECREGVGQIHFLRCARQTDPPTHHAIGLHIAPEMKLVRANVDEPALLIESDRPRISLFILNLFPRFRVKTL